LLYLKRRAFLKGVPAVAVLAAAVPLAAADTAKAPTSSPDAGPAVATDLPPIALVKPQADGGKSVLAALQARRTIRQISDEKLSPQTLSNLLWAAWGVNREKGPFGPVGWPRGLPN
jgi:hypothetical protein